MGDARGHSTSGPEQISLTLRVNWGRASASQLECLLVDREGGNSNLANFADEVSGRRDVCRVFDKALHAPNAGAHTV